MRLLIIGAWLHHKNKQGLDIMLTYIQQHDPTFMYKYAKVGDSLDECIDFDIMYSPATPINAGKYPNVKFIFGPHFSVFPNQLLNMLNNKHNNCKYIQPSEWCVNVWKSMGAERVLPVVHMTFPVNTDLFRPLKQAKKRSEVFIYFKRRTQDELNVLENYLREIKLPYTLFDYVKKYEESDYLHTLQNAKFGIVLDAHEIQGFAIEEALSCDVPLLVWNASSMSQEVGANHPHMVATSIPYWDKRCGEVFHKWEGFKNAFNLFLKQVAAEKYSPRDYIIQELSAKPCAERFLSICQ